MLHRNIWISPDQFFIIALLIALTMGMSKKFIRDWSPFILIILSYEFLRGALPAITKFPVHSTDLIQIEQAIFHQIPTLTLQKIFYNPNNLQLYDYIFSLTYMSFFIAFMLLAFLFWVKNQKAFRLLAASALILYYLALITFVIFPAMPPWMASDKNLLPHVYRILWNTTAHMTVSKGGFPTMYNFFAANDVAAMPSLHAAVPTLMFIISLLFRHKILSIITLIYALTTYFTIVYIGEHYAIDAMAGIIYAIVAIFTARKFIK